MAFGAAVGVLLVGVLILPVGGPVVELLVYTGDPVIQTEYAKIT